ncbi:hypothetical protein F966_01970 [Acinetobacter higginsii]|uniref:Uncharacterized protein n=1 Tax=Acinetobacter higginsii TaxID=70347 RepID=N8XJS4_9GAMM|nr:hypothetical protein [Acinetobacter higginsii]ENV09314.1 hypothetical protein F966_01970 [Acinetobacter higginsii]
MKISKLAITLPLLLTSNISNADLFGYSWNNPTTNPKGEIIATKLDNPFDGFLILDGTIYNPENISNFPGSVIVIYEDSNGKTKGYPYIDRILKDGISNPKIRVSDLKYDTYLLETKDAISLGIPVMSAGYEKNSKVEYKFFKSADSSISFDDLDKKKFSELAKAAKAEFENKKDVKFKSVAVILEAAILTTSFSMLKGTKANSNINGPGWQVGGLFYSSQEMSKNRTQIGVYTANYTPSLSDTIITTLPPVIPTLSLEGKQGIRVGNADKSSSETKFSNIMRFE